MLVVTEPDGGEVCERVVVSKILNPGGQWWLVVHMEGEGEGKVALVVKEAAVGDWRTETVP
jgi:hypothetical protein